MGISHGLCVLDARVEHAAGVPELIADVWRVGLKDPATPPGEWSLLEFYWQAELSGPGALWTDGTWVSVKPNDDYEQERGTLQLSAAAEGANWKYFIDDFAEAVLLILPEGMGAVGTEPPAQATIKRGRLMLLYLRPAGAGTMWKAAATAHLGATGSALRQEAGQLNRAHQADLDAQRAATLSRVRPADPAPAPGPDRTLQVALVGLVIACIGVIVAATTQHLVRIGAIVMAGAVAVATLAWLAAPYARPRLPGKRRADAVP